MQPPGVEEGGGGRYGGAGTPSLAGAGTHVPRARAAAAGVGVKSRHCFSVSFSYVMQIFAVKLVFLVFFGFLGFFFVNIVFDCVTYYKGFIRIF